jgi:hypothetical protein
LLLEGFDFADGLDFALLDPGAGIAVPPVATDSPRGEERGVPVQPGPCATQEMSPPPPDFRPPDPAEDIGLRAMLAGETPPPTALYRACPGVGRCGGACGAMRGVGEGTQLVDACPACGTVWCWLCGEIMTPASCLAKLRNPENGTDYASLAGALAADDWEELLAAEPALGLPLARALHLGLHRWNSKDGMTRVMQALQGTSVPVGDCGCPPCLMMMDRDARMQQLLPTPPGAEGSTEAWAAVCAHHTAEGLLVRPKRHPHPAGGNLKR